ncbi:hypothetical protein [Planctomycetes bacterium TBK1r]|uniref:hypothetical protein n=1 Tax=Stieleria magnilauensis TaxID=2527963 RepID=UPI00119ED5C8
MKLARDNVVDSERTVTATADLKLPRPKTIRDLSLATNLEWQPRTADLRANKILEISFTKLEAPMRDFSARHHATESSATTAKVVQSKSGIDMLVDAKDEESEAFYLHHGFVKLESRDDDERTLVLPISKSSQ